MLNNTVRESDKTVLRRLKCLNVALTLLPRVRREDTCCDSGEEIVLVVDQIVRAGQRHYIDRLRHIGRKHQADRDRENLK